MTTDTNPNEDRYIDKITKLLAKAESTTPEEAEALTAKATELMLQHSIDTAMIEARTKGLGKPDRVIERKVRVRGVYWKAHQSLGLSIGRAYGFKVLVQNDGASNRGYFYWIGFESDIASAEMLYTSLLIQCAAGMREFSKAWRKEYAAIMPKAEGFKARRSFIFGFGEAVGSRLRDQRRLVAEQAEAAQAAACPTEVGTEIGVALVLADRQERVTEYYDERYGNLRAGRRGRYTQSGIGGRSAGISAGNSANLGGTSVGSQRSIGR